MKQEKNWREWTARLTSKGFIVFEAGLYGTVNNGITRETWDLVTQVHFRKIEMSDKVLVIRKPDGTVGHDTQIDIDHARSLDKPVENVESFWKARW